MNRPWQVWSVFVACVLVAVCAMGWMTHKALELNHAEREARRQAHLEEYVRLSLWNMESVALSIVVRETTRPHEVYSPLIRSSLEGGKAPGAARQVLRPSPLLLEQPELVRLHFQIGPDGEITSPQVPTGDELAAIGPYLPDPGRLEEAARRLESLRLVLKEVDLRDRLPPREASPPLGLQLAFVPSPRQEAWAPDAQAGSQQPSQQLESQQSQAFMNDNTWQVRQGSNFAIVQNLTQGKRASESEGVEEGTMLPLWIGDEFLLARRVVVRGTQLVQGCWIDWPALASTLLDRIAYLLPDASLRAAEAVETAEGRRGSRMLAALPVSLVPGKFPLREDEAVAPLRLSLLVAWGCVTIAALAVVLLLKAAVSLSERRASFVSAVTHELRTPLTTFRMYTEMLADGMVLDEEKRRRYIVTLGSEALRLSHLVENVLAYARLERTRGRDRLESLDVDELVARTRERLENRAAQVGLRLDVARDGEEASPRVLADPDAVDQILCNLVDNACKYAVGGAEKIVHIEWRWLDSRAELRVRDHGPGVPREQRRALFRPFSKSALEAAHSAPGVGLGLALSRRLARAMGGELRLDAHQGESGACFVLSLRVTRTAATEPGPAAPRARPESGSRAGQPGPSGR